MTHEPRTVILGRFETLDDRTVPGSEVIRANCGHLAWISPQGRAMGGDVYTLCVPCFEQSHLSDDEVDQINLVPGAAGALGIDEERTTRAVRRDEKRRRRA